MKSVKLYVEHDKEDKEYEVIVKIGRFTDKEEAASYASFIYLTSSLDFGQRDFLNLDHKNQLLLFPCSLLFSH